MAGTAPYDWKTAKDALYAWLVDQLGISVIWAKQDAPRPAYPYAVLDLLSPPRKTGEDEQRWEDEAGALATGVKLITTGDRVATFSCEAFVSFEGVAYDHDADANAYMSIAQASLALEDVHNALVTAGLSVRDVLAIRDLSGGVDASFLSRAVFDFQCGLAFRIDPASYGDSMNTVRVSSTLSGQSGTGDLDLVDEDMGG